MIEDQIVSEDDQNLRSALHNCLKREKNFGIACIEGCIDANGRNSHKIKARVEQTQTELLKLMLEVENVSGQVVSYYRKTNSLF